MSEPLTADTADTAMDGPRVRAPKDTPFYDWTVLTVDDADGNRWWFHVPTKALDAARDRPEGLDVREAEQKVIAAAYDLNMTQPDRGDGDPLSDLDDALGELDAARLAESREGEEGT